MRVAFLFPNFFPYVRRGAERLMMEYATHLTSVGHQVDILTSKPGPPRIVRDGNLTIYYDRQINHPVLAHYWRLFRFYTFSASAFRHLARRPYDVIHLWLYMYGLPVRLLREVRGTPYLYHQMQELLLVPGGFDRWLFQSVVPVADRLATLTPAFAAQMEQTLGVRVDVLPPCVDLAAFTPDPGRDLSCPRVLFASDTKDPFKGASLLLRAWDEIHRRCPQAILTFGGPFGQVGIPGYETPRAVDDLVTDPAARAAIEFLGEGGLTDVPRRYAGAAVTVLPSVWEGFGLVLLESLACGTPVVGNALGGPGHIINDSSIGSTVRLSGPEDLNDPDRASDLANAVLRSIQLAHDPTTSARCRERAACWSRQRVGQKVEHLYREMVNDTRHPQERSAYDNRRRSSLHHDPAAPAHGQRADRARSRIPDGDGPGIQPTRSYPAAGGGDR